MSDRFESALVSLALTALANGLLTIAKEMVPPLYAALKALGGHHWIGQGIALIMLFALTWPAIHGLRTAQRMGWDADKASGIAVTSMAVSSFMILGYFALAG